MERTLFAGGPLLDPEAPEPRREALLVEDGRIEALLERGAAAAVAARRVDLAGRALAPGFVDLHFHGRAVFDALDAPAASLRQDAASILRHGVTAFLPTTVAWAQPALVTRVMGWVEALDDLGPEAATPLGLHLEGPWISPRAAGAQPGGAIRPFTPAEGAEVLDRAAGRIRMVTLAPEAEGAGALLEMLVSRDVVPALGHTRADAASAAEAVDRGARHVTHLFNAMGPFHHRAPGAVGVALADPRLTCDVICDGVHLDPATVRVAARAKGEGLALITDRVDPPPGAPGFGSGAVHDDGVALRLADGTLAGSRLGMARAVANATAFGAMTRLEAVAAATLRPARVLGVESRHGTLRPGARADLVVLEADGAVAETWLAGRCVHPTA